MLIHFSNFCEVILNVSYHVKNNSLSFSKRFVIIVSFSLHILEMFSSTMCVHIYNYMKFNSLSLNLSVIRLCACTNIWLHFISELLPRVGLSLKRLENFHICHPFTDDSVSLLYNNREINNKKKRFHLRIFLERRRNLYSVVF